MLERVLMISCLADVEQKPAVDTTWFFAGNMAYLLTEEDREEIAQAIREVFKKACARVIAQHQ